MEDLKVMDKVRVLIFRMHEKGLEVFLLDDKNKTDEHYKIPLTAFGEVSDDFEGLIQLDPTIDSSGNQYRTIALEEVAQEIPSIRGMIKSDISLIKNKLYNKLPDMEKGTFIAVKEVIKKNLPNEYAAIKELKDILTDRNLILNI